MVPRKGLLFLTASALALPVPALAHHAMGGAAPASFFSAATALQLPVCAKVADAVAVTIATAASAASGRYFMGPFSL